MKHGLNEKEHHFKAVKKFNHLFGISIGYPDVGRLRTILGHFSRFPSENISKIIKNNHFYGVENRIRLPVEVMEGFRAHHLGGTCFSLTCFLETILTFHGYSCYPIMADMRYGKNVHCALIVILDGEKYLADPGYCLNQPVPVTGKDSVLFKNEFLGIELLFDSEDQIYHLHTYTQKEKKWRYQFRDIPIAGEEFLNHWLASFSWNSMHGLCLYKLEKNKMTYIHKYFMRETGPEKKRNFNIRDQYHKTIHELFQISPDLVEEALTAVEDNMARDRESGLWVPKKIQGD